MGLFGVGLLAYRRSDAPTKHQSSIESFYVTLLIAALTKLFGMTQKFLQDVVSLTTYCTTASCGPEGKKRGRYNSFPPPARAVHWLAVH
jgi:hypothetical protein